MTDEEVNRSKQRFAKFNEQLLASSDRFAVQLSEWAGAGDWRLYFLHRDRLEKVTAADVNRVAQMPDISARLADLGMYPRPGPVSAAGEFLRSERVLWQKVVKDFNIPAQ